MREHNLHRTAFSIGWSSFSALLLAVAMPVAAEESESDGSANADWVEEIIVTAEKREENVLDVPLTMSAFSAQMLEELGMTNDEDLENMVPGLQFGYDTEGNGISMRGIGTQKAVQYNADLAVAFYVDGVYTNDIYGLAPNLFDIERVEVARGPQGTLNGRNSIAGSVSYYNKRPTDTWDLEFLSEFTDQFSQRYNVAFGGPIDVLSNLQGGVLEGAKLSFRITAGYHEGDGAQENIGSAGDLDAPDEFTFAPQIRLTTDRADVNLRYQQAHDTGSSRAQVRLSDRDTTSPTYLIGPWPVANPTYLYDQRNPAVEACPSEQFRVYGGICDDIKNVVVSNRASMKDNETERWSFNFDYDISDTIAIRYTFGSTVTETWQVLDGDSTARVGSAQDPYVPADCVTNYGLQHCLDEGVFFQDTEVARPWDNDESSHEVQLFSDLDGPFNFVVGVYKYQNESHWRYRGINYADPRLFYNAEERVALIDLDEDGTPDYANCEQFYQQYVLGDDDPATPYIDGVSQNPSTRLGCEPGNDHSLKGGSSSGAAYDVQAFFVNGEYKINDAWQVSGGLRTTEDKKSQVGVSGTSGVAFILDVPITSFGGLANRADEWKKTIGHVSVEYTPDEDRLYYGRISTGFRAGGFNQISGGTSAEDIANNIVPATFEGEELVNYEVGIKGLFLDQRLMLSAGAYKQFFDGFHLNEIQRIDPAKADVRDDPFLEYTGNIDGTEIGGAEVEATWYINDRWRASGFYNYLDSSVGNVRAFFFNRDADDEGTFTHTWIDLETGTQMSAEIDAPRDATGRRLPQQPKHKGALTLTYSRSLPNGGGLSVLSSLSFTGEKYPNIGNIEYQKLDAYKRWDLRVSWDMPNNNVNVTGYVQNVLDEVGIQEYAFDWGWLTEPRQVGVQVRWRPQLNN